MVTLTGCALLDTLAVLAVLAVATYLYYASKFTYWKRRGVPYPKPLPVVGNFLLPLLQKRSPGQIVWDVYNAVPGARYVGFYIFGNPALVIRDPNLVKHVLVKDFNMFGDRFSSTSKGDTLGTQNLFTLKGAPWKYLRMKLSPTFTSGRMKKMFPLVVDCARQFSDYLKEHCEVGSIEVKETTAKYATDVISSCAFGIESNSLKDPNAEFREFGKQMFNFTRFRTLEVMALFFSPGLMEFLKGSFFSKQTTEFLRKVFWDTICYRETNQIQRDDFLGLLIQLKNKGSVEPENGESLPAEPDKDSLLFGETFVPVLYRTYMDIYWFANRKRFLIFQHKTQDGIAEFNARGGNIPMKFSGDNLLAQPAIFFVAGFETNATTVSFTLYELALQPELQTKLRAEIAQVMRTSKNSPSYEDLFGMKYLHMVVSETLRKYPPLPLLDRVCLQDYKVPGTDLILEKGTPIFIPLLGLQRDPKYFPNPEMYDPERFEEENKRKQTPYTYLPFGEGPHNCIGLRFGLMSVKIALVHILAEFEVKPSSETPIPLQLSTRSSVLATVSGIPLKFVRSKAQEV